MTCERGTKDDESLLPKAAPRGNGRKCGSVRSAVDMCECSKVDDVKCATCVKYDSLRCERCPMVFLSKSDLVRHLSGSHSKQTSSCRSAKKVASTTRVKLESERRIIGTLKPLNTKVDKFEAANKSKKVEVNGQNDDRPRYRCADCSKVCLSARGLTRHCLIHKRRAVRVNCNFCALTFTSDDEKRQHMSDYHRINEVGEMDAVDQSALKMNSSNFDSTCQSTTDREPKTDCNASAALLLSTKTEPSEETSPPVSQKNETEIDGGKKRVKKSNAVLIRMDTIVCSMCSETFDDESKFTLHQRCVHGGTFAAVCDICELQFPTSTLLRAHKIGRHRNRRAKLTDEEDPFSKWYVFADDQKHLKCDLCNYNSLWYHKGRFLEHYRIHTGEKPYTCDSCGKQFRTKTLLSKHVMFVHEGIKEHPCDICGRRFSDKRYMVDHRRIHTGERPYICDLCGKTFKQSASLFVHKELHKGLRKHACDMCGKRFTTRSSLNIHIKRHIGERNFVCAICGKAFVDGKHLKDHMAVHSDERPFACELCGGRFKLLKHLKQHGRTHKRDIAA